MNELQIRNWSVFFFFLYRRMEQLCKYSECIVRVPSNYINRNLVHFFISVKLAPFHEILYIIIIMNIILIIIFIASGLAKESAQSSLSLQASH